MLTAFKERYVLDRAKFLDNLVPIIVGAVSLIASVLQIIGFVLVFKQGNLTKEVLWLVVLSLACILALIALTAYMFRTLRKGLRQIEKLRFSVSDIFHELHGLCHQFRNMMYSIDGKSRTEIIPFFQDALDGIKVIFDRTTGANCHFCIKMFVDSDNNVVTMCRDKKAVLSGRNGGSDPVRAALNTGLSTVMAKGERFFCNDLFKLDTESTYLNTNPHWRNHYVSTIITPIGYYTADPFPHIDYPTEKLII